MELLYTKKFLKLKSKIRNPRSIKDTEKILNDLLKLQNLFELEHSTLDIKKRVIDNTYRVRYSGKPEMRIVFRVVDQSTQTDKKQVLEMLWIGSREDYEIYAHNPINEEIEKKVIIYITESQFKTLEYLLN